MALARFACLVVVATLLAAGCTSTRRQVAAANGCAGEVDGCFQVSLLNVDQRPLLPDEPKRDGRGTFHAAVLAACPVSLGSSLEPMSETTRVEVDLGSTEAHPIEVGFLLEDPRFGASFQDGDAAAIAGFLDDNGSADADYPLPGIGDPVTNCVEVVIRPRAQRVLEPLAPCIRLEIPPVAFSQAGLPVDCSVYAPFVDGGSDAGPGDASGATDAGDAATDASSSDGG
ncbi:MAG: hypothetical protein IT376_13780 [Polyangiaceae bacterium]|nr:hypothetical protein [Polyangiaceae bacterium]